MACLRILALALSHSGFSIKSTVNQKICEEVWRDLRARGMRRRRRRVVHSNWRGKNRCLSEAVEEVDHRLVEDVRGRSAPGRSPDGLASAIADRGRGCAKDSGASTAGHKGWFGRTDKSCCCCTVVVLSSSRIGAEQHVQGFVLEEILV